MWKSSYLAFGSIKTEANNGAGIDNPLRFAGQYHDRETGLFYNLNRYYDPAMKRYLTQDPVGLAGGLNPYLYVDADPISRLDPLGLKGMPSSDTTTTGDRNPEPKTRLPRSNGHWEGEPGNGDWYSDLPEVNEITGGKPIPFKDGRPDFSEWSEGQIEFESGVLNGSDNDFDEVYKYLQKIKGLNNKTAAKALLNIKDLTPHHLSNTVIQLIPTKLHGKIPHIGSASDMRRGI
ncbi:RHS repeat-associated core domain-containing protein [Hafnia alvei]|uniref:RHS repeat-associated core domain-containing protein n=1 Tax=Hafnia alvei TaxID=569 RepID=UPI002AB0FF7A|nr:RHS repeat-associated core domain-containing protein [Hafnia alvei]